MVYNAVYEMLIEITPLETHHGERSLGPSATLARRKLCEAHSAQTRIHMQSPLACRARLTIAQACELFSVTEKKCELEARFDIPVDRLGRQGAIRAEEQCISSSGPVAHDYQT
jgi:hypothetical protein